MSTSKTLAEAHPDWQTPILCTWCGAEIEDHDRVYVYEAGNWLGICPEHSIVYVTTDPDEVNN